jgi:hypothetical protein
MLGEIKRINLLFFGFCFLAMDEIFTKCILCADRFVRDETKNVRCSFCRKCKRCNRIPIKSTKLIIPVYHQKSVLDFFPYNLVYIPWNCECVTERDFLTDFSPSFVSSLVEDISRNDCELPEFLDRYGEHLNVAKLKRVVIWCTETKYKSKALQIFDEYLYKCFVKPARSA